MPRIRSLKPDLPQRADLGACSRDARLLFLLLKTLVDDDGRTRAGARLLGSLLFPYDDPAELRVAAWLGELAAAGLLRTYHVGGAEYLQLAAFRADERIDHPTASKLPPPPPVREASENFANAREASETFPLDRIGEDRIGRERKEARDEVAREASRGFAKVSEDVVPAEPPATPAPKARPRPRPLPPAEALRQLIDELLAEFPEARVDLLLQPEVFPAAVDYFAVRRKRRCPETTRAWATLLDRLAALGGSDPARWAALLAHNATAGYMTIYPDAEAKAKAAARAPKTTRTDAYLDAARRLAGA